MRQKKHSRTRGGGDGGCHVRVPPGHVSFRLLCTASIAGALVAHPRSVLRKLERDTFARILVDASLTPETQECLLYVIGSDAIDRKLKFETLKKGYSSSDDHEGSVSVSSAQEALVRVFERIFKVESATGNEVACCWLLATNNQIGALIGKGGKRIERIRYESGAFILAPPSALYADNLIQIKGNILAVKKALVAVSQCLQQNPPLEATLRNYADTSPDRALQPVTNRSSDGGNGETTAEAAFKILCSSDAAASLMANNRTKIRSLQEGIGASILFAAPVEGCDERLLIVKAMENMELYHSPAQIAAMRVSTEVVRINTGSSDCIKKKGVAVRLLIMSNQVGCLIGLGGKVISGIRKETGAMIRIHEGNRIPYCRSGAEKVVQIVGEFIAVQNALLQVTSTLRDNIFSTKRFDRVCTRAGPIHISDRSCPSGREKGKCPPYVHETNNSRTKIENLKISYVADASPPHNFLPHQAFSRYDPDAVAGHRKDPTLLRASAGSNSNSNSSIAASTSIEITVPRDVFSSICTQDGCNLAFLREISGAKVVLHNPSSGGDGKFIITGRPNQTLAAVRIVQAFILSSK